MSHPVSSERRYRWNEIEEAASKFKEEVLKLHGNTWDLEIEILDILGRAARTLNSAKKILERPPEETG